MRQSKKQTLSPQPREAFETFFCAGLCQLSCLQFPQDAEGWTPGAVLPSSAASRGLSSLFLLAMPEPVLATLGVLRPWEDEGREDTSLHPDPGPSFLILYLPNPAPQLDSNRSGSFTNLSQRLPPPAEPG